MAHHTTTMSITRRPSLRNKENNCSAGTSRSFRPPSLGRLPRPGLWKPHVWPLWPNPRVWDLQKSLKDCTRTQPPNPNRWQWQLFLSGSQNGYQVFRTPIQNVATAARIADSIQPSRSEAGEGLRQIRALLRAAREQNSAVSQSRKQVCKGRYN